MSLGRNTRLLVFLLIGWVLVWLFLGLLFPHHPHIFFGHLWSPITALPLWLSSVDAPEATFEQDWKYVYFPAIVFWCGVLTILLSWTLLWWKRSSK